MFASEPRNLPEMSARAWPTPCRRRQISHCGSFLPPKKKKKRSCRYVAQSRDALHFAYSYLIHAQRPLFIFFFLLLPLNMFTTSTLSSPLAACPQGTFKSFQGAGLCQQCPLNSRSTIEAATLCGCRNGYYRGDMDKPEDICTSESV